MRTDATFDNKQVKCPNVSMLGHGKWKAQVGDLVVTKDGLLARMIGRVVYAPCLTGNTKPICNYILAVAMCSPVLDCTGERWINPIDVVRVESIDRQRDVLQWFLSNEMINAPLQEVRMCANEGWSTIEKMRDYFMESRKLSPAEYHEYRKQFGKQASA